MDKGISLYEITEAYKDLQYLLDESKGDELLVYLDGIEVQMKDKVSQLVRFSRNLELTAGAIDTEIERLQGLKKSYENKSEQLKNYLSYSMQKHGIERVDTDIAKLSFRKSQTVEIENIEILPERFIVTRVSKSADKNAIKEAIVAGEIIDGARIANHLNLQIK